MIILLLTPPAGLVSDAFILGEYSDLVMFIVRQGVTPKKQLDFINDLINTEKFNNLGLIINDVRTGGRYGVGGITYNLSVEKTKRLLK